MSIVKFKVTQEAIDGISEAGRFVAVDDSRPALWGICLKDSKVIATDDKRLYWKDVPDMIDESKEDCILPPAGIQFLGSLKLDKPLEGEFTMNPNYLSFENDLIDYRIRTICGNYPNYKVVIPPSFSNELIFPEADRKKVIQFLKSACKILKNMSTFLYMNIGEKQIRFDWVSTDHGAEAIFVDNPTPGCKECKAAFNPLYLQQCFEIGATVKYNDGFTPFLFEGKSSNYVIIMPMRNK